MPDPVFATEITALRKRLAGIFAAAALCILAGGLAYHHSYQQTVRRAAGDLLASIRRFKTDQIIFWRNDRLNDTESLLDTPVLSRVLNAYAAAPADKELRGQLTVRLTSYLRHNKYRSALLAAPDGRVMTGAGENAATLPAEAKALIRKAAASGRTEVGDFYVGPSGRPRMDVVSKAAQTAGGRRLYLVLEIAPDDYLYPLLQAWPTNSRTGETVLARVDGRDILFLGDLRKTRDAGMKLRFPLAASSLPIARALNGEEGTLLGTDYNGDKVLAAVGMIPGTNWAIAVKMDWSEIASGTGRISALILLFTFFLVAAAGGWAYLLFRLEAERYSGRLAAAETERERYRDSFRMLADKANDMFLLSDPAGRSLLMVNRKTCETYGYTEEELLRLHPEDMVPPEELPAFNARFAELGEGKTAVYEVVHMKKDGTRFPVEVSATGVRQDGKNLVFFICRDITERRRTEEKLESAAREWAATFDAIDDVIWMLDADHRIVRANAATARLFQHGQEYVLGRRCWEIIHGTEGPIPACPVEKARRSRRRETLEYDLRGRSLEIVVDPIQDADGRYAGAVHILRDITERKRAEETLRASEERYEQLFATMEEGFAIHSVIFDGSGSAVDLRFLDINPAFERLTGLKRAEVVGRTMLEVLPGTEPEWIERFTRVALTGEPIHFERPEPATGKWYEGSAFRPREGQLAVTFFDITEQKNAQFKLEAAQKDLLKSLRLYTLLEQINEAAAQTKDLPKLYSRLCEVVTGPAGGFRMAWVAYPDRDTGRMFPICSAGAVDGYLDHIKISATGGYASKGPSGAAARAGAVRVCQDIAGDPAMAPWREACAERGYLSSAAVPLYDGDELAAVLNLYSAEKGFFTEEEVKLLNELKDDVSLAIEAISSGEKHGTAQNALERTATQLTHLMEAMPVVLFTLKLVGGRAMPQWVSGNSESVTGYEPVEMLAPDWFERCVHPEDRPLLTRELSEVFQKGQVSHDFRLARKDGSYSWVHSQLKAGSEKDEVIGSFTDITPLKESELRFRKLFERAPLVARPPEQAGRDEIYMVDPESGRMTYASIGALMILGYTREEMERKMVWEIVADFTPERFKAMLAALREKPNKLLVLETEHVRKDGTAHPVQSRVQQIEGASGPQLLVLSTELLSEKK